MHKCNWLWSTESEESFENQHDAYVGWIYSNLWRYRKVRICYIFRHKYKFWKCIFAYLSFYFVLIMSILLLKTSTSWRKHFFRRFQRFEASLNLQLHWVFLQKGVTFFARNCKMYSIVSSFPKALIEMFKNKFLILNSILFRQMLCYNRRIPLPELEARIDVSF